MGRSPSRNFDSGLCSVQLPLHHAGLVNHDEGPGLGAAMDRGRARAAALRRREMPILTHEAVATSTLEAEAEAAERLFEGPLLLREQARVILRGVLDSAGTKAAHLRAEAGLARLREIENGHFEPLRARLRAGAYTPQHLLGELAERPAPEHDLFVDRLLGIHDPPPEDEVSDLENSPYLASSWSLIQPLLDELGPDDVFFDLGSGLGKVPFLVHWFTGARAIGVEYDARLGATAETVRDGLGLDVELRISDARFVDYRDGTFFYLFEPFRGAVLDEVMAGVERAAARHRVRVATAWVTEIPFSPPPWLNEQPRTGELRRFASDSPPTARV